jgi:hypothetical protein
MEYAPSVNTNETSFNPPSLPRRHSIQFNGIMLPPISSITPLEPVAETGTTPDLKVLQYVFALTNLILRFRMNLSPLQI